MNNEAIIKEPRLPQYGGQALIEGVLMRGKNNLAASMRAPDGQIITVTEELKGIYKSRLARIPFLRGLVMLWDSLGLGMRYLTISANTQTGEDEKLEGPLLYLTIAVSLAIGIGMFILLPTGLASLSAGWFNFGSGWQHLFEGIVRLLIAVVYIWAIGLMPDIKRVFMYHGAEHKVINTYEAGIELTPENAAKSSIEHPRCGTSFLLTVLLLSIIVFAMIGPLPGIWQYVSRVLLLPLLACLAYEYIRFTAKYITNPIIAVIIKPNLWLQRLTTRQPTLEMLEVSIFAFNSMIEKEQSVVP